MYRNQIESSNSAAFGCSHTWGVGVECTETWSYLLGAKNFGVPGVSSDFVARTFPDIVKQHKPSIAYVLWPDWTRFEYLNESRYYQSLPTDSNRIEFMEMATDEWLQDNFTKQQDTVRNYCKEHRIKLVDITLYDLVPYFDNADRWPLSRLGHHYSPVWHTRVADIFRKKENEQT
jgi:hypothetical protein